MLCLSIGALSNVRVSEVVSLKGLLRKLICICMYVDPRVLHSKGDGLTDRDMWLVIDLWCYIPFGFALLNAFSGVDPLVFAVLCGISSGVVGFLLGGATFNVIWKSIFRQRAHEMHKVITCSYIFLFPGTSENVNSLGDQ